MQAIFRRGNPTFIDYTPGSAVSAGDVIPLNDKCYIAHQDIAANEKGSVAVGGGIYEVLKDGTSGPTVAIGEKAYWNDSTNVAEATPTSNTAMGWFASAADGDDASVLVEHGSF
jgi:predicted RecA/RadA family phage recombinase